MPYINSLPPRLTVEEAQALQRELAAHIANRYFGDSRGLAELTQDIAEGNLPNFKTMTNAQLVQAIRESEIEPADEKLRLLLNAGDPGPQAQVEPTGEDLLRMASEIGEREGDEELILADLLRAAWNRLPEPGGVRAQVIETTRPTWEIAIREDGKEPSGVGDLIRLARQHGEDSEPDHECGDLQDFFRAVWDHPAFGREERFLVFQSDAVKAISERLNEDNEPALAYLNASGNIEWGSTDFGESLAYFGLDDSFVYTPYQAVQIANAHYLKERYGDEDADRHTIEPRRRDQG